MVGMKVDVMQFTLCWWGERTITWDGYGHFSTPCVFSSRNLTNKKNRTPEAILAATR